MSPKKKSANKVNISSQSDFKFIQLVTCTYEGDKGLSSSLAALGNDGFVYQYRGLKKAWEQLPVARFKLQTIEEQELF